MKEEITSKEYWALPESLQERYHQVTQELAPHGWIDRIMYGGPNTQQLRTIYRKKGLPKPFGGMGMGTF
jgi:hypothetical protein